MPRARAVESNRQSVPDRGADPSAPRSTPLTLVAGAVAGDDLQSVAATVAQALECPVAIAIPALGDPVVAPPGSLTPDATAAVAAHAISAISAAAGDGEPSPSPCPPIIEAVPVRIGDQIVGIVAAAGPPAAAAERRAWLEAAAAAASVTALIRESHTGVGDSADLLVAELAGGPPEDLTGFLVRARRLGCDLSGGAVAVSARPPAGAPPANGTLADTGALVAQPREGHVVAVVPLAGADRSDPAGRAAEALRVSGMTVAVSAPRRDPALLHEALREADLLLELAGAGEPQPAGQDETYRLLIGVLLRDRSELRQLRDTTTTPLAAYDDRHDTDLLATLRAFLAHDGSTTETAEAMQLHRHTVGYRLARVHEVSGLSPYESDGRERLSLGLKAHQILEAERRLAASEPAAPGGDAQARAQPSA
jgi:hypothetical protein